MGLSGVSLSSLLVILLIAMLVFGTKRLSSIGKDLGAALKGFREGMAQGEAQLGGSANHPGAPEKNAEPADTVDAKHKVDAP